MKKVYLTSAALYLAISSVAFADSVARQPVDWETFFEPPHAQAKVLHSPVQAQSQSWGSWAYDLFSSPRRTVTKSLGWETAEEIKRADTVRLLDFIPTFLAKGLASAEDEVQSALGNAVEAKFVKFDGEPANLNEARARAGWLSFLASVWSSVNSSLPRETRGTVPAKPNPAPMVEEVDDTAAPSQGIVSSLFGKVTGWFFN